MVNKKICVSLSESKEVEKWIKKYPKVLSCLTDKIKYCDIEKCPINTEKGKKVNKKGQVIPQALKSRTKEHIELLDKRGIIRKSSSDWRNPIRVIEKDDGSIRLVSNLMALNDLVDKDPFQLANIRDVVRSAQGSIFLTVIDLKEAFYFIEIVEEHKHKTAFEFDGEIYEWNSMVMGFKNSPQILQRVMSKIFNDLKGKGVEIYMDDILVHAGNKEDHDRIFEEVLRRLELNKMRLNPKKLQYARREINILGVTIDGKTVTPTEIKKNEALEYPRPSTSKDLKRFLGLAGWFREFIKDFSSITKNLTNATRDNILIWHDDMELEFKNLKRELREMKQLALPDYLRTFLLRTDASNVGIGAVLMQETKNKEWVPIQWASKKLTPAESRYGISEKEMLAVYWGIKKFEYELRGRKFILETDHKALEEIRKKPEFNNNRINRWIEIIQEFDFEIRYLKGIDNTVPDALSRIYEQDEQKNKVRTEIGKKIYQAKIEKHVIEEKGIKYWRFDDGSMKEIPNEDIRRKLITEKHEELQHGGLEAVYYGIKSKYYWPGMKQEIDKILKSCEICAMCRKKSGGSEFVETKMPLEKFAIDLIDLRSEDKYVLVGIDYFTRLAVAEVLDNKETITIVNVISKWIERGIRPQEIISDNGKEFVSRQFEDLCLKNEISHRKVSIESHKSNGRVERLIGSIREGLVKSLENIEIGKKIEKIIESYNNTYHSGLKRTLNEA